MLNDFYPTIAAARLKTSLKLILLGLVGLNSFYATALAKQDFFVCPNSYQAVHLGDSQKQVLQACGAPQSRQQKTLATTQTDHVQEWVYLHHSSNFYHQYDTQTYQNRHHHYRPKLKVRFNQGKISKIIIRKQTNFNPFQCYRNHRIQVGTPKSQVIFQCGYPDYVHDIATNQSQPRTVTIWGYDFGGYQPKQFFIFKGDQLTQIKTGHSSQPSKNGNSGKKTS